jgi:hypothetical protein
MIVVKLIGGLGNQLFQYALGRHLAEINSTLLKLDLSGFEEYKLQRYGLHCYNIWQHIASIEELKAFKQENNTRLSRLKTKIGKRFNLSLYPTSKFYQNVTVLKEKCYSFDPLVLEHNGNIYLDGYWQSEKYFLEIRDILLKEFTIKHLQDLGNNELSKLIQTKESISIHIRRGDYVNNPITNMVHGLCPLDYYQNAVELITKTIPNCHFYIFSDDPSWAIENLKLDYPTTIVNHNNSSTNYEDLRLMSLCSHNIIANSSFSWWGAWLNTNSDKIVIAPKKWYNDNLLNAQTVDLIPDKWIRI